MVEMAKTRNVLAEIHENLDESLGVRTVDSKPQLSPVAKGKDVGRRALRSVGLLEVARIITDPEQPRREFDADEIESLARSIVEQGQIHPIRVRWSESHEAWMIISGERRFRAAKLAGLSKIQCSFHEGPLCRPKVLEQQLIENLLRSDLRPIEEAKAFVQLMEINGWNGKQLAEALRITTSRVTRSIKLLTLSSDIQAKVERNEISPTAAYELAKAKGVERQKELLAGSGDKPTSTSLRQKRNQSRKRTKKPRGTHLKFIAEDEWLVTVSCPRKETYNHVAAALRQALEEAEHRAKNNRWI